jgi:hypothetical protein
MHERIAATQNTTMDVHNARRACTGSAVPSQVAQHRDSTQANHDTAARRDGLISIRLQKRAAERRSWRVFGYMTGHEISGDLGVRQFEKLDERGLFFACRSRESLLQVTRQEQIELLHASAAAPLEHSQALLRHGGHG